MNDYRMLSKSTEQQKKYYKAAEHRNKKQALRCLGSIFAVLSKRRLGLNGVRFADVKRDN